MRVAAGGKARGRACVSVCARRYNIETYSHYCYLIDDVWRTCLYRFNSVICSHKST